MAYLCLPVANSPRIFILIMVSAAYIVTTILLPKYFNDYTDSGSRMTIARPFSVADQDTIVTTILLHKYFNDYTDSGSRMTIARPLSVAEQGTSFSSRVYDSLDGGSSSGLAAALHLDGVPAPPAPARPPLTRPTSYSTGEQHHLREKARKKNIMKIIQEPESSNFWIKTPTCTIPKTPIGKKSESKKKLKCGTTRPLTEAHDLSIKLFPERLLDYKDAKGVGKMSCAYQGIVRIQQDPDHFTTRSDELQRLKPAVQLVEIVTSIEEDGVQVSCTVNIENKKKVIYKNIHTFFRPSRISSKLSLFKSSGGWPSSPDQLNVVIVGVDSMSRINLMRHMPKTYKFLTKDVSAIDFHGYNKVADNTDPNLSALLMGWSWEQFRTQKICHKKFKGKFDECPLIWKNFSSKGYLTAYGEDAPHEGVFHYSNRNGYVIQPTDYYNRPYFLMSEKFIGHDGGFSKQKRNRCQGTKTSFDVLNDWNIQLLREMKEVPIFSFTWTSSVTHSNYEDCRLLDDSFYNYFRALKNDGHLDNTVLVFISDHGARFGAFRQTYPGMMEERLPHLLLVLPPRFKEKYPVSWNNINLNKERLVTHFDLHSTLLAIANQDYTNNVLSDYATVYGQSLFNPIPLNRTCQSVGIIDHYCTCSQSEELDPSSAHASNAAVVALNHINDLLKYYMECSQLELHKVSSARLRKPHNSTITLIKPKKKKKEATKMVVQHSLFYIVTFETLPGNAVFESTVQNPEGEKIVSDVSRINMYGNQSHCIENNNMKKFCFCKDFIH